MPAIVPGTVLNSLVHNKVYPEPYYGMNNKLDRNIIPDLAKTGREFYTYWFRTEFDVPENYKDKIVWLQVDGINYRAEIWVNGYLLGNMSGMFKPEYINITDFARIGQKNALAIKVYPVDMPGTIKPKQWGATGEFHNGGDGNIGLNTTMLMSVGWDLPSTTVSATVILVSGKTSASMLRTKRSSAIHSSNPNSPSRATIWQKRLSV